MANLYIKGVDISGYQPNVDFNAVKNDGVEVCIIKATESTIYPNSAFDYQVNGCISNGINFGFYHFFRGKGYAEADYFCDKIEPYKDIMKVLPVIDAEILTGYEVINGEPYEYTITDINEQVLTFINRVKERLDLDCIIYAGAYFLGDNLTDYRLKQFPVWIAHYGVDYPTIKGIWTDDNVVGHQYSEQGYINGIGNCDVNRFNEKIYIEKKIKKENEKLIGGIYRMAGSINMRAKYRVNGVDVWTKWYNMDTESGTPYKNIIGIEIYTELPLKWGVCMNQKYINVEGSGIIEGAEVYGFQAYLTDHSKKTYYWVSSPGDVAGFEWWGNNCQTENVPAVCKNSGGTTPLNAVKLRLG